MCYLRIFIFTQYFYVKKAIFFFNWPGFKTIITKSLSIQANRRCTYAVSQKESDPSYFYLDFDKT